MTKTKILVVDDEVNLTKMLKLNLEETDNYEVRTINDAKLAVEEAKVFQPALILLDIMMPDIQGNELAEKILEEPELQGMKIVFLTAIVTKAEAPDSGKVIAGRRFLAKPIKIDDLLECIEEELGNNPQ